MKKAIYVAVIITLVAMVGAAQAATIGSDVTTPSGAVCDGFWDHAKAGGIKAAALLELYGDDRDQVHFDTNTTGVKYDAGNIYALKLSYVIANRVEPYVVLGKQRDAKIKWTSTIHNPGPNESIEIDGEDTTVVGGGIKVLILDLGEKLVNIKISGDIQGRYASPKVDKFKIDGATSTFSGEDIELLDFQEAFIASLPVELGEVAGVKTSIVPYAGVVFSQGIVNAAIDASSGTTYKTGTTRNDDKIGLVLGTDLTLLDYVALGIEGRLIDQEALNLSASVKF